MKDKLTATRMTTLLACLRRHYWRYEVGLKATTDAMALRFGTAWHAAMEARWQGFAYPEALAKATAAAREFAEIDLATLAGMLAGYYGRYDGDAECVQSLHAEQEFVLPLVGSRSFESSGKIDGLGVLKDGRLALVEHKTAGKDIGADSAYWLRLRFNPQVYQYVLAARALGWDVGIVVYDVARKPAIAQKQIPVLDAHGCRIVNDALGNRVIKSDGSPRESADNAKGFSLATALETPEEFGDRLVADTRERPDFYFARREVPILDQDVAEFEVQRLELSRLILLLRGAARRARRPEHAWARNCGDACQFCEFSGFCMQNISVDPAAPPAGFRVGPVNEELRIVNG
jgi:hypothetical protein